MAEMSNPESSSINELIEALVGDQVSTEKREMTDEEKNRVADIVKAMLPHAKELETTALLGKIEEAETAELESRAIGEPNWAAIDKELETLAEDGEITGSEATPLAPKARGSVGVTDFLAKMFPIHPGYNFHVLLGINPIGEFAGVSGIEVTHTPFEYQEGGKNDGPHQLMDKHGYGKVTLKSGLIWDIQFSMWMNSFTPGTKFKKSVTVIHLDREHIPIRIYRMGGAIPISWKAPNMDSMSSAVSVDELTFSFESLTTIPVPPLGALF